MSATSKKASNSESSHQLNTLTDIVRIVGETRSDVKALDRKVDRLEQKIDQQGSEISELKADTVELKADNAEIKEILKHILSRLPTNQHNN